MAQSRKSQTAKFQQKEKYTPSKLEKNLIKAFTQLKDEKEVIELVRDLMTHQEIQEFANRLEIAQLLYKGYSYQEVSQKTGVSTTTVTRVAHWLYNGCGGYWKYLQKNS